MVAAGAALLVAALVVALSVGGGSSDTGAPKPTAAKKERAAKPPAQGTPSTPAQPTTTPEQTVNAFYQHAARHDYPAAWSLLTPRGQRELGGLASFSRAQSTLRSISFTVLSALTQTAAGATVELRSNAVHANRTDHVCGTVGLVRSGSRWLLDAFHLDTCPAAVPPGQLKEKPSKPPKPSRAHGQAGAEGGD